MQLETPETCNSDTMSSSSISSSGGAGKPNQSDKNDLEELEKLQADMLDLYKSGRYSDITIRCEEQEFKVHKAILRVRCPSMFRMTNDCGLTPDNLHILLLYIYGGTAGHQDWSVEQATELALAADKCKLDGLKRQAEKRFCSGMNIDNVLKVLEMTDIDKESYPRSVAIKFIAENVEEVTEQPGWKDLDTHDMTEIIKEMTRQGPPPNKKPRL